MLVVEGADDEHVIRHVCEQSLSELEFDVAQIGGIANLSAEIEAHAKVVGRSSLGVVVDANADIASRWQSIRDAFGRAQIELPSGPDGQGTVVQSRLAGVPRVGVWLMPDNTNSGEREDFLARIIPAGDPVWPLAQDYVQQVESIEALSKPAKSRIHSWLAVRTEGGRLGTSIRAGAFDLQQAAAQSFLTWLRRVFPT